MSLYLLFPEIILFVGALIILLLDVFVAKKFKDFFVTTKLLAFAFGVGSIYVLNDIFGFMGVIYSDMIVINPLLSFIKFVILCLFVLNIALSLRFIYNNQKISSEFIALYMMSVVGAMVLVSANDFLVFYLGIELLSLPLYLLAAINKKSKNSSESGIKYFILGCVASGILLFGISIVYGFSGTTNFNEFFRLYFASSMNPEVPPALLFGFVLILVSLFFKVSAAPFHMWAPDVYQGAPLVVTTFFASVTKFALVVVLLKLFYGLIRYFKWPGIDNIFIFVGILSLIVGSLGAISQKNIKRLLAYSSIGHIGFIVLGMTYLSSKSFVACLVYIIIYSLIAVGSFAFLHLLKNKKSLENDDANDQEIFTIANLAGFAKSNPLLSFCFATLMFSSAGIPPLAGFFSKFYIISSLAVSNNYILAIIAVLFSVISAYYYLRIVKIMYFDEPQDNLEVVDFPAAKIILILVAITNIVMISFMDSFVYMISTFSKYYFPF